MNIKSILNFIPKETVLENAVDENSSFQSMAIKVSRWRLKYIQAQRRKILLKKRQAQWRYLVDYLKLNNLDK